MPTAHMLLCILKKEVQYNHCIVICDNCYTVKYDADRIFAKTPKWQIVIPGLLPLW